MSPTTLAMTDLGRMRSPTPLIEMGVRRWDAALAPDERTAAVSAVESGGILFFPHLAFALEPSERRFLSATWSDGKAKNISLDLSTGIIGGAHGTAADLAGLSRMIGRFADCARALIATLFPCYGQAPVVTRTSFRPVPAHEREIRWRRDDRLLHVDAFPSRPNGGARILRVFNNADPGGEPRVWRTGEPFEDLAAKFLPGIPLPLPGAGRVLAALRITKGQRTRYDHIMLQLHDRMKADAAYQSNAPHAEVAFPAGSTWVCFSDQVTHAVLRGQYMFEQTLQLPVAAMQDPDRAPIRVLERLAGRALA
jgi:hypothetical protein